MNAPVADVRLRFHRAALRALLRAQVDAEQARSNRFFGTETDEVHVLLVDLALEAVMDGMPGDGLLTLASLTRPTLADVLDVLPAAAADLHLQLPADVRTARAELFTVYPQVGETFGPILRDIETTGGPRFSVEAPLLDADGGLLVFLRKPDGSATGVRIDPELPVEAYQGDVLDRAAEAALEASHGAWPACPHHPGRHPLFAADGHWHCHQLDRIVARIGDLSPPQRHPCP